MDSLSQAYREAYEATKRAIASWSEERVRALADSASEEIAKQPSFMCLEQFYASLDACADRLASASA